MAQTTTGAHAVLSLPGIYDLVQNLFGAERSRAAVVREYLRPQPGERLLDIGCGTARILPHLPATIRYVGVDLSPSYIESARRRFGDRGKFACVDMGRADPGEFRDFDLAIATGLLHHLDDDESRRMLTTARAALREGGRLITFDGCFDAQQSRAAHFMIARDRGLNVRTAIGYAELARDIFAGVKVHVRHDLLRIPYTHAILELRR